MEDVIEKFIRSSGPGGQNVNKTSTCVYLKHVPTGIEVKCGQERSQAQNRRRAWELLRAKLTQLRERQEALRRQRAEKVKRQNRRRPRALKERILESKRLQARKKKSRSLVRWED